ncbi:MAG: hypothetical protein HY048_01435 [Acidobacteria bacterium]|nr:hypothetical protein [Acidobacteriota bacterium]
MARRALLNVAGLLLLALPARALDVRVKDVRAAAGTVQTSIELRDLVPDRFRHVIDEGGVLHVRVQTELWESRPVWDRLVYPAMIRMFRLVRAAAGRDVSLVDADAVSVVPGDPGTGGGRSTDIPLVPVIPLIIDMGDRARVTADSRYYVHAIATVGTLAEREVDEAGDAVFGRAAEANGLGSLGRTLFRTALQVSGYLQSVSAEARSRKLAGRDITH